MPTLLLRLAGPMQSWGTRSRFDERDTDLEPSKSGVLGLLCAAMGVPRDDWAGLKPLALLRMGARVDAPGVLRADYHTAQDRPGHPRTGTVQTRRHYLADAAFLVGLEGDDRALLERAHAALRNPVWPLALGRRSFPPSLPVWLERGLVDATLEPALLECPHVGTLDPWSADNSLPRGERFVLESEAPAGSLRFDQPTSSFADRRYAARHVEPRFVPNPAAERTSN